MIVLTNRLLFSFLFFLSVNVLAFQETSPGLKFIENKNQWSEDTQFGAWIPGGNMIVSPGRFRYHFIDTRKMEEMHENAHHGVTSEADGQRRGEEFIRGHAVEVTLSGSNPDSRPMPFGRSSEYYNYFIGSDPGKWASKAHSYEGILYASIYTGIDLKIYSSGENLKYDFIVSPIGDPSSIRIHYQGADELFLDNGNLMLKTTLADMIEKRPFTFQYINGKRVEVASEYTLEDNQMSFCFPNGYDPCYELVIDPQLIFSTYSGSAADNWGSTATPGEHGNLYSSGVTNHFIETNNGLLFSGSFPATSGAFQIAYGGVYDVGILKYDSIGQHLLYASYLGGTQSESPHSLLMNKTEELIVLGTTSSTSFPTTVGALSRIYNGGSFISPLNVDYVNGSDIFISRISKDGTQLIASTFLGGSGNDGLNQNNGPLTANYGDQLRGDVIADDAGNIYISSVTSSPDFPMRASFDTTFNGGPSDAILVKLDAGLTQIKWGAFIGGSETDASHTIKLDQDKNIFIGGGTTSSNFPTTAGSYQEVFNGDTDGWIAKIGGEGDTILYSTLTGTPSFDQVYFVDLNQNEEVYVYGQTTSGNFPHTSGAVFDGTHGQFLQKFSNNLSVNILSTTFGSGTDPNISPTAFLVSDCNTIYMSGWGGQINQFGGGWGTTTHGMPISPDAFQPTTSGSDFYFIVLEEDAQSFLYGTYLGGNQSRTHVDGGTSRFDKEGVVYHAVCSGCNSLNAFGPHTSDFPTTPNAWSRTNNSQNCNNAAFKFDLSSLKARLQIEGGTTKICLPDRFKFNNLSSGGEIYYWDFGDGTTLELQELVSLEHDYKDPGEYTVRLVAYDPATCIVSDTASVKVSVFMPEAEVQSDDTICSGESYQLKVDGGVAYHWRSEDGSFEFFDQYPIVTPEDTTLYIVDIVEASGCSHEEEVLINVVPGINPDFEIERQSACTTRPYLVVKSLTDSLLEADEVFFDFGDGTTSDASEIEHFYEKDSVYTVRQVAKRGVCVYEKSVPIPVFTMTVPNVITPGLKDGDNDFFTIQFGRNGDIILTPGDYGFIVSLVIYSRWGEPVYQSDDYKYDWSGEDVGSGVYYYKVKVEDHAPCKSWIHVLK